MNSKYELEFSSQAAKFLKKLKNKELLQNILSALDIIRKDPLSGKFLQGDLRDYHSYRVGTYRVIYRPVHDKMLIFILRISHRKESY
ncbi:MAG: type II toxin-antitoxin system RelE/ParE family toxin [Candidatus Saganbacteria bacterium]|nr:type II toxin-antitoxin system RelE/ParE family toxin [Candidatus Saganbacteria bacterium]